MAEVEVNGAVKKESESEEVPKDSPKKKNNADTASDETIKVKSETEEMVKGEVKSEVVVKEEAEPEEMDGESTNEATAFEKQIIRQIEYYFGDINLPRDKFLQEQIKLDDGWIPLEVMLKFQRLANLSKELDVIITALKKSENGLIEVNENGKKIRRNPKHVLPQQTDERRKALMSQTVYCKGFPEDSTLDNLLEYFQKYGKVDSVIMRHFHEKKTKTSHFKGSAFIIFSTREQAEEFLKLEEVKYGETTVLRLWQSDYLEKKRLERKQKPHKESGGKQEEQEQEAKSLPRGTVLHLKGDFGNISREELKSALEANGDKVAYINYNKGDEEGYVRMQEENTAKTFAEKLEDSKLALKESSVEVRVLDGEEEETFLSEAMSEMIKRRNAAKHSFRGRRGGRGGGRGGRGGPHHQSRKRRADDGGEGPPSKKDVAA